MAHSPIYFGTSRGEKRKGKIAAAAAAAESSSRSLARTCIYETSGEGCERVRERENATRNVAFYRTRERDRVSATVGSRGPINQARASERFSGRGKGGRIW